MKLHYLTHCLCLFTSFIFLNQSFAEPEDDVNHLFIPENVKHPAWLQTRSAAQREAAKTIHVFHNFTFQEQRAESEIDFLHRIVDDAGKFYKAVHYDHGNGIAVADIDNDGYLDVYFVSQLGTNGLYKNLGNGQFKNITQSSGTAVTNAIGVSASFADIDNDGDADLYVTNVRSPNVLYENLGDGTFKDISSESGLNYEEHSSAATFFDYDRDGLLDVFLSVVGEYTTNNTSVIQGTVEDEKTNIQTEYHIGHRDAFAGHLHPKRNRLSQIYRNLGNNRFENVTQKLGLEDKGWSGDATPVDFNGDGWIDLYSLNMQGPDHYWENEQGKRFVDKTQDLFPSTPWGAMGVKSFDYNNDGLMDLMISDMHSDMSERIDIDREKQKSDWILKNWSLDFLQDQGNSIYGNALFQQNAKGNFTDVSDEMNTENYWPWGMSVADINADGWQDILLTSSMNYPFRYAINSLLLNDQGKGFKDAEYILGIEPRHNQETSKPWFQLDCSTQDKRLKLCNEQQGKLVVHGAKGSRSSAIFDFDNDGDLDIFTNEFGDQPQVLVSNLNEIKKNALRFIKIKLQGQLANRDGLGAIVKLSADGKHYTQIYDGKSGYLSQSSMPLYFGLGDHTKIDSIEITWPSGIQQTLNKDIAINTTMVIEEPERR